jgi:hypothetical protein
MPFRMLLLVVATMIAAVACGGASSSAGTPASPGLAAATAPRESSPSPPQRPETTGAIVMCDLMPGSDVAGAAPFSIPLQKVVSQTYLPQSCEYRFASPKGEYAGIRIDLQDWDSHEKALASLQSHVQAVRDAYHIEPDALSGIGDRATWSVTTIADAGIDVVFGARELTINLGPGGQGMPASDAARRAAAIALAKLALERLR